MVLSDLTKSISKDRYFITDFPNGKIWGFGDIDNNCTLLRIKYIDTKETGDFAYDWQMKQPLEATIVASGIMVYYLHFPNKDFKDLFEDYFSASWKAFLNMKNKDRQANFDFLIKSEAEQKSEFMKIHIIEEKASCGINKELYEYLSENDRSFLDKLVAHYFKWIDEQNVVMLPMTDKLKSIFHNDLIILQKFLQRIKNKKGVKIVDEVVALVEMGKIDDEEKGEDLRKELAILGYDTTTKQNWSNALNKGGRIQSDIKKIQAKYQ